MNNKINAFSKITPFNTIDELEELESLDLIICNILETYDYRYFFEKCSKVLSKGGELRMAVNVTGAEDAYINALLCAIDPAHTRYPKPTELIKAAADYLFLESYSNSFEDVKIPIENIDLVQKHLSDFPESVFSELTPAIMGNIFIYKKRIGTLVWSK